MMNEILPLSLRPKYLSEMVGQDKLVSAIRKQIATRPPSAFLLHGGTGVGKTSLARILALSFQCQHQSKLWGEPCDECWSKWPEFCIHEINASETNGVEEIKKVAEMGRYRPAPPSHKRVIILDEAQLMSNNAQNLLLKHFEEASKHTVWIICTTVPNKVIVTLRRRCMTYQLHGLSFTDRETLLKRSAKAAEVKRPINTLIEAAAEAQLSSPALLLMALEKYAAGFSPEEAVSGNEGSIVNTLAICKAVTAGNWAQIRDAIKDVTSEDVRWVRASVSGWLCGVLKRESSSFKRDALSRSILVLTEMAPIEETLLLHWLWARMHSVCKLMSSNKLS
jgi:hypothetical protein